MSLGLTTNNEHDTIQVPDAPDVVQFAEDGEGEGAGIEAILRIRDEVGEHALTDEEYALLQQHERMTARPGMDASDHNANLAEHLDENVLTALANDVIQWVRWDEESRDDWQALEKKGIRALGVSSNTEGGAQFDGASTVVHPLLGEACVQFASRAMDVMWPAEGPVRTAVLGAINGDRQEQAQRVEQFMNYQYTQLMAGAFEQTDKLLIRLPLSGSCFIKAYYDPRTSVTRQLVESANFIVPYQASDLQTSPRYTERIWMSKNDVRKLQVAGVYRDIEMIQPHEGTKPEVVDEISDTEGRTDQIHAADDQRRTLYECYCERSLPGFEDSDESGRETGIELPYIVTVDKDSRKVLGIYRDWRNGDPQKRRLVYHVHYRFMPGLGFYGYGLYHWIGGLSDAATGALRALLDAAQFSNLQGGWRLGEVAIKDPKSPLQPGEYREIATEVDDIRKALLPHQYKEPSMVLFNLLGHLEDLGRQFAGTTEAMTGGGTENTPVGTLLARIEQGSKVFTTIQRRLHQAAAQEYKLVAWLNSQFLPQEYPYAVEGEDRTVMAKDFDDRIDVIPASDPNVISATQRFFVSQAVLQLAQSAPGLYDQRALHKRALQSLRIDNIDELLPDKAGVRRDPVTEGAIVMTGGTVRAFMEQHHPAHIAVHQGQLSMFPPNSPMAGVMQAHIQEHLAQKYLLEMRATTGIPFEMPDEDSDKDSALPPEVEAQIAMLSAQAAQAMMPAPTPSQEEQAAQAAASDQQRKDAIAAREQDRQDAIAHREQKRKDALALADATRTDRTEAQVLADKVAQREKELMGGHQL